MATVSMAFVNCPPNNLNDYWPKIPHILDSFGFKDNMFIQMTSDGIPILYAKQWTGSQRSDYLYIKELQNMTMNDLQVHSNQTTVTFPMARLQFHSNIYSMHSKELNATASKESMA